MKTISYLVITVGLLILSGCYSTISITEYSAKTSVDFTQLKTWQWDRAAMGEQHTTADKFDPYESILKVEVSKLLEEKNYHQIADGQPDFRIDYRASITEEAVEIEQDTISQNQQEVNDYGPKWTFGNGEGPAFKGFNETPNQVQFYEQCIVHLAAFDHDGNMIWHVSASVVVNPKSSAHDRENSIRKAAQELMARFPAH